MKKKKQKKKKQHMGKDHDQYTVVVVSNKETYLCIWGENEKHIYAFKGGCPPPSVLKGLFWGLLKKKRGLVFLLGFFINILKI